MARTKPKNMINDRNEAEEALQRIDEIDRQFADMDMKEALAVARVREQFISLRKENNHAGLEAERKLLVKELEAWAETESRNWKGKTLAMRCGKIGYRISQPAVALVKRVCKSFAEALDKVELLRPDFVRTRKEVDKEAILAAHREGLIDDASLEVLGLKVTQKDEFWIETMASKDLEEAAKKLRAA